MIVKATFEPMRLLMLRKKVTGVDLAKRTGQSRGNISDILNDKGNPRFDTLCAFAHILGCTLNDLAEWSVVDERQR